MHWNPEKTRLLAASHCGVRKELPGYILVTTDFMLEEPWSDMGCKLVRGIATYPLSQFFSSGEGPRGGLYDPKDGQISSMAKTIADTLREEETKA